MSASADGVRAPGRRAAAFVFAATAFFWLQREDSSVLPAVLLGWAGGLLLSIGWLRPALRLPRRARALAIGAAAGLAASAATAALMLFKSGWHGHEYPDYPPVLILEVLARAPIWALAAGLAALGLALVAAALAPRTREP